jgi:phosphoribosylanthranilate isomerase
MSTQFVVVQLYEVQTPEEAEALLSIGVDHIGSVILSASRCRDEAIRETVRVTRSAGARSSLIPLFDTVESVLDMLDYHRPDIVHFCEALSDADGNLVDCRKRLDLQRHVKKSFPEIAVMRSIPIAPPGLTRCVPTLELAALFEPATDWFLTDTHLLADGAAAAPPDQPVSGFIGITGRRCDWAMARRLVETARIPVILAGGISPENVMEGLQQVQPAGIDSCTGTNARSRNGRPIRFKKDLGRVRRLVDAVRAFEAGPYRNDQRAGARRKTWQAENIARRDIPPKGG